ncbi:ribosomal large subunit pseudouridine synthase B [Candidatus Electrothrix communis]|uniref:Pseudouridine synthase n=1 Tax=Candidatus Electrothrix communis TaxID=1859133 RepID=A0A444J7J7_9BACT|nr:ribosomal large subunit pseudouridine synthase B [Candidatus Electrothrix communis]
MYYDGKNTKNYTHAGICSRRKAEEYIAQGRVKVDGKAITQPGFKVDPEQAIITVDGKPLKEEKKIYILLHKPRGYVTTMSDPQGRPIVTDLLPEIQERLFPVGRLDLDSEGALLLTNDGALANQVIHLRFEVNKTYEATVRDLPKKSDLQRLEQGIVLDGKKTWPARLRVLKKKKDVTVIEIIIHEGKKRQVRKMFQAIGHPVIRLKRTAYGRLRLENLPEGRYRFLDKIDVKKLFCKKN